VVRERSGENISCKSQGKVRENEKLMPAGVWCLIFKLKCIKFVFRWGSATDPAGGAYSATLRSLAALNIAA